MMDKQYICVAMRGRPIDNPSCRTARLPTAQRLDRVYKNKTGDVNNV